MPRTLQFKRYGSATLANTIGANGELIINSTNKTLTVHDGVTPGGFTLLNEAIEMDIDQYARNTANTASNNITIIQGVNVTQNTNITNATNLAQAAYNYANTIVSDTQIDPYARTTANSASNNITIIQGVNDTQNTRLNSIETINTNQNTSISIIQGVDNTQNTNITTANNAAWAAFTKANNALANTTGSWTVTTGTNTYSFTVPSDGTYTMWVKGNIANGIIIWNATLSISNSNVPAIGTQYAWNYTGGGSPILLTTLPDQIRGTANTISTDNTYVGSTSNRFDFGISNSSGSSQTIYYGYTKI